MKILLTGPSGFVGSAFTRLALSRGHQVAGLLIPSEPVPAHLPAHPGLLWLRGTLQEPPWEEIERFGPEVCVHAAWITTPGIYLESPENERFRDSSLQFLRALRQRGLGHMVSLGTCIEYQVTGRPLSEDHSPIAPATAYARCKNELRLALEADARAQGFAFCWTRIFYPYGPGEHPSRLCSAIVHKLMRGEKLVLKTPASTKDYIFIEDLAEALLTVVERRFEGVINLGTGQGVEVRRLAGTLGRLLGKAQLVEEQDPPEIDPAGHVVAEVSKLQRLGWRPTRTLESGLEKLVDAVRGDLRV
jgi:nucleoside-diphosphate-sugar epimerase